MEPDLTTIQCPVCKSYHEKLLINTYDYNEVADHICPAARNEDRNRRLKECIKQLWQNDYAYVVECKDCGFGFGIPYVGGSEKFYSIIHEQKGYPSWRWDYEFTVNNVVKNKKHLRILDIGAGEGLFLKRLKKNHDVYALEGSEITRAHLRSNNIAVFPDLKEAIQIVVSTFDIITLFQVLEHLSDFENVLRDVFKLLNTGGKVIISVPYFAAMKKQEKHTGAIDYIPNHINKWTAASLEIVLKRTGFTINQIQYESSSLKRLKDSLQVYFMTKASQKNSLANKVYGFKNKKIRILLLGWLAIPVVLKKFLIIPALCKGGSFLIIAEK